MNLLFSIIIPVYNRSKLIIPAINSVINQNYKDWELIIIDDASTDDTVQIIREYLKTDKRVKLIQHKLNKERGAARNSGIKHAKGEYICFLDSDDTFLPNHLSTFYNYIIENKFPSELIFTNSYLKNEDNEIKKKIVPHISSFDNKFAYLLKYTPNPARVCVKRNIVEEFLFDPSIPGLEDIDLWLRIATKFPISHIEELTNIYFVHNESYTLGDEHRFEKELINFRYIFKKEKLRRILPKKSKNRLLSMCYFHLANRFNNHFGFKALYAAICSFFLFPKGYNNKTNKILLTIVVYNLPIIGYLVKIIYQKQKSLFGKV